jgi:hypothetical protein
MGRHNARDDERLRSSLRDAAEAYQPDRQAISTRVAQGRAADRDTKSVRRSMLGLRPVGAAFAVVGVLVASGVAVRAGTNDDQTVADPPPPAVVPAPVSSGSVTSPSPGGTVGSRVPTGTTGSAPPSGTSGTPGAPSSQPPVTSPAAGASWLEVSGGTGKDSVATWSEKRVFLHNTSALVALNVTITIPMSANLAEAGKFTTVPNNDVIVTITPTPEGLTYTFALRDGVRLMPGKYEFAAQFNHKSGRVAAQDSFSVDAATASATAERTGAFS